MHDHVRRRDTTATEASNVAAAVGQSSEDSFETFLGWVSLSQCWGKCTRFIVTLNMCEEGLQNSHISDMPG